MFCRSTRQVTYIRGMPFAPIGCKFPRRPQRWKVGLQICSARISNRILFDGAMQKRCKSISPYLIEGAPVIVQPRPSPLSELPEMVMGSNPVDGRRLIFDREDFETIVSNFEGANRFFRQYGGTE